jgi:6,7-dimethyl-8-ribityllumazine synthase
MSTVDAPERRVAALEGPPPKVLIIQAPYYAAVIAGMQRGARRVLSEVEAQSDSVDVAGAFELPAALRLALTHAHGLDGCLLLGCVVRGETDHYTFICDAVCHGVMAITAATGFPVGFGLLTVDTLAQAEARSADDRHNKGAEAAHALLGQIALRRRLRDA